MRRLDLADGLATLPSIAEIQRIFVMLTVLVIALVGVPIVILVVKAGNKTWEAQKALWEPHSRAFSAAAAKKYRWTGTADGTPLHWRLRTVGGGGENGGKQSTYFAITIERPPGGEAWQVHYNVPTMFNRRPEGWTISGKDPAVESAFARAGLMDRIANMPRHFAPSFNPKTGRLTCEFEVGGLTYVQPLDEFTRFVATMREMAAVAEGMRSAGAAPHGTALREA